MSAFSDKLAAKNEPLPQEEFEGVDDDEWVSWIEGQILQ